MISTPLSIPRPRRSSRPAGSGTVCTGAPIRLLTRLTVADPPAGDELPVREKGDARLSGLSTTYRTWFGMIIKDRRCVVQETVQETLAILVTLCDL